MPLPIFIRSTDFSYASAALYNLPKVCLWVCLQTTLPWPVWLRARRRCPAESGSGTTDYAQTGLTDPPYDWPAASPREVPHIDAGGDLDPRIPRPPPPLFNNLRDRNSESNLLRVQMRKTVRRRATRVSFQVRLIVTRRRMGGSTGPRRRLRRRRVVSVVEVAAVRADGPPTSARRLRRRQVARLARQRHRSSVGHRQRSARRGCRRLVSRRGRRTSDAGNSFEPTRLVSRTVGFRPSYPTVDELCGPWMFTLVTRC